MHQLFQFDESAFDLTDRRPRIKWGSSQGSRFSGGLFHGKGSVRLLTTSDNFGDVGLYIFHIPMDRAGLNIGIDNTRYVIVSGA